MNRWHKTAITNLLADSNDQDDFEQAVTEWRSTGLCKPTSENHTSCELCEQERLAFHFQIENELNGNQMLVGSSCITKFNIAVYNLDGQRLYDKALKNYFREKIGGAKEEAMLEELRYLYRSADNDTVKSYLTQKVHSYKRNNGFRPEEMLDIIRWAEALGGDCTHGLYKINLRTKANKEDLLHMSQDDQSLVLTHLSPQQHRRFLQSQSGPFSPRKSCDECEESVPVSRNRYPEDFLLKYYRVGSGELEHQEIRHGDPFEISDSVREELKQYSNPYRVLIYRVKNDTHWLTVQL